MRKRFAHLVPGIYERLELIEVSVEGGHRKWKCRCVCGAIKYVQEWDIRAGKVKSCGCWGRDRARQRLTTHGMTKASEYYTYNNMMGRCYDKADEKYAMYGGRGISVCERWRGPGGFARFIADVGRRPAREYTLDRYPDMNGNYQPENCRWATSKQQARNTRRNVLVTVGGETKTVAEWSEVSGIASSILFARLGRGVSGDEFLGKGRLKGWPR